MADPTELRAFIERHARASGFDHVGFCGVEGAPGIERYDRFLALGRHGSMEWMVRGRAPRAEPRLLLPGARAAVVLGLDYARALPPDPGGLAGRVSRYAWGRDYHNRIGKRLRGLQRALSGLGIASAWGVDARPFVERAWAERAGVAFLGRNCCAIAPGRTSWLFLAVGLVAGEVEPDAPLAGFERHCGACRRCLDACPTGALVGSGELDARRCVSYLTIEHRGPIPEELRPGLGRWLFGCDDCQAVCPHNRPPLPRDDNLSPLPGRAWVDLPRLLATPDADLDRSLQGSPLRRARPEGLKRNACVVLGNIGDPAARPALIAALSASPLVAEHARWSLDRIGS